MLRTREEWYKVAIERGTDGSMVFDILKDWKEESEDKKRIVDEFRKIVEKLLGGNDD